MFPYLFAFLGALFLVGQFRLIVAVKYGLMPNKYFQQQALLFPLFLTLGCVAGIYGDTFYAKLGLTMGLFNFFISSVWYTIARHKHAAKEKQDLKEMIDLIDNVSDKIDQVTSAKPQTNDQDGTPQRPQPIRSVGESEGPSSPHDDAAKALYMLGELQKILIPTKLELRDLGLRAGLSYEQVDPDSYKLAHDPRFQIVRLDSHKYQLLKSVIVGPADLDMSKGGWGAVGLIGGEFHLLDAMDTPELFQKKYGIHIKQRGDMA